GNQLELQRNNLKSGIYFYKISDGGNAINSGKIVVN
ncbi:MAG TPA: T9SS type A sorting domain-containing protein, partial [Phaeodactylibacter sp.]|nr:T9SS type A sorting domain-containing protein [Phaeodactylibacter sp.]